MIPNLEFQEEKKLTPRSFRNPGWFPLNPPRIMID